MNDSTQQSDHLGDEIYSLLVRRGYAQHEAHRIAYGGLSVVDELEMLREQIRQHAETCKESAFPLGQPSNSEPLRITTRY